MLLYRFHLIAFISSLLLIGACSSVETGRKTHLSSEQRAQEAEKDLNSAQENLSEIQIELENRRKIEEKFTGGFKEEKNADGSAKMATAKRSAFESDSYREGGSAFTNKNFSTKQFDSKSFAGAKKNFDTSAWKKPDSLTDIKLDTPEFAKNKSDILAEQSEYSKKKYANTAGEAEESRKRWEQLNNIKAPEHLMNQEVVEKRDRLAKPHIMTMREAQLKTVEEVRMMMGRD